MTLFLTSLLYQHLIRSTEENPQLHVFWTIRNLLSLNNNFTNYCNTFFTIFFFTIPTVSWHFSEVCTHEIFSVYLLWEFWLRDTWTYALRSTYPFILVLWLLWGLWDSRSRSYESSCIHFRDRRSTTKSGYGYLGYIVHLYSKELSCFSSFFVSFF